MCLSLFWFSLFFKWLILYETKKGKKIKSLFSLKYILKPLYIIVAVKSMYIAILGKTIQKFKEQMKNEKINTNPSAHKQTKKIKKANPALQNVVLHSFPQDRELPTIVTCHCWSYWRRVFFNELVIPSSAVVWSSSSSCIWIIVPRALYIFVKVSQRVIRGWGGFSLTAAFYNLLPLQSFIPCGVALLLAQTTSNTCLCSDHTELASVHHRYQGMASMCSSGSHLSPHPPPQPPRRSVHEPEVYISVYSHPLHFLKIITPDLGRLYLIHTVTP